MPWEDVISKDKNAAVEIRKVFITSTTTPQH